jgi:hypothetical protein
MIQAKSPLEELNMKKRYLELRFLLDDPEYPSDTILEELERCWFSMSNEERLSLLSEVE